MKSDMDELQMHRRRNLSNLTNRIRLVLAALVLMNVLVSVLPTPARAHTAPPSVLHQTSPTLPSGFSIEDMHLEMYSPSGSDYVRFRGHMGWSGGSCTAPHTTGQLWLNVQWYDEDYNVVSPWGGQTSFSWGNWCHNFNADEGDAPWEFDLQGPLLSVGATYVEVAFRYIEPYGSTWCATCGVLVARDKNTYVGEPPLAPTNLRVTQVTQSSVALAWDDNSLHESEFVLQRSDSGTGTWATIATFQPNMAVYSDTAVELDHIYDYRIRAVNGYGASDWSNTLTVSMFPIFPANLRVTGVTPSSVRLAWDDTLNETAYDIQRSLDKSSWTDAVSLSQNSTGFMDSGRLSFTNHYYRVRARNASGASAWSGVVLGTTTGNFDFYNIRSYVAMGDSYSAGEGLFPYFTDSMTGDNKCHRSPRAYPSFVRAPSSEVPLAVRSPSDWRFIACSGARISNVRRGGSTQAGEPGTQLDQSAVTANTDLVTITIGGNDAGFAEVLSLCLWHACTSSSYQPFNNMPFTEWLPQEIDALWDEVNAAHSEIREASPSAALAVLGYPRLFPDTPDEQNCFKLNPWDDEQTFLNAMNARFEGIIEGEANSVGAFFVPVAPHFANHEVCGDGGEWMNGPAAEPELGVPPVEAKDSAFHPNETGQREYATPLNLLLSSGGTASSTAIATPDRGLTENPGSLGDLHLSTVIGSRGLRCGTSRSVSQSHQVRLEGSGFVPDSTVSLRLVDAKGKYLILDKEAIARTNSSILQVVDLSAIRPGSYGMEAHGTGLDGATRILLDSITVPLMCFADDRQGGLPLQHDGGKPDTDLWLSGWLEG